MTTQTTTTCSECGREIDPDVQRAYNVLYGSGSHPMSMLESALRLLIRNRLSNTNWSDTTIAQSAVEDWLDVDVADLTRAVRHRIEETS